MNDRLSVEWLESNGAEPSLIKWFKVWASKEERNSLTRRTVHALMKELKSEQAAWIMLHLMSDHHCFVSLLNICRDALNRCVRKALDCSAMEETKEDAALTALREALDKFDDVFRKEQYTEERGRWTVEVMRQLENAKAIGKGYREKNHPVYHLSKAIQMLGQCFVCASGVKTSGFYVLRYTEYVHYYLVPHESAPKERDTVRRHNINSMLGLLGV